MLLTKEIKKELKGYLFMILGCIAYGMSTSLFLANKGEEISKLLLENSPRGITMWDGQGMYTHKDHNV